MSALFGKRSSMKSLAQSSVTWICQKNPRRTLSVLTTVMKYLRPKGRGAKASGGVRHGDSYKGIITDIDVYFNIYEI